MTAPDHMPRTVQTDLHNRGHPHMRFRGRTDAIRSAGEGMAGQGQAGTLNDDQAAQLTGFAVPELRRLAREGHVTRSRKGTYHLVRLVREIVD